ncbi:hypothetical protein WJU23_12380 [Prosthecobacter sp. SYSU 5D2]|uniref:hypothetical protein n=1 Tax=Prosthecobacter sp. SYSU 5D2 TaxID=3134134 RepID=UPI0031FF3521
MKTYLLLGSLLLALNVYGNVDDLIRQGDTYDAKFQPDEALKHYLPAEKRRPGDAALMVKIARQYVFRMDELSSSADKMASAKMALSYAEKAVKAAPATSDPHLSIAIVYGKMTPLLGNKEKIEVSRKIKEAAEKAVKLNPRDDYAWHLLGRWHQALAGMGSLTRGIARLVYGELPAASNEEAVKCFEKALSLNPRRLIHHIELGRTFAQMGRTEEARQAINKGLAMPDQEKDDPETKRRGRAALDAL